MQLAFKQRLFYFFPVLFCFCLPFGYQLLSAIMVCWLIISFFNFDRNLFKTAFKTKQLWLPVGFFLFTCLSAFFSDNGQEAARAIEVKFSFVLMPYFFFCFKWPLQILKRCVTAFVSGCFFACVVLVARAFYFYLNGNPDYFFYSQFSYFIHASYFAMYLILAITFSITCYPKWFAGQQNILRLTLFFISVFVITIFLCSSKLGLISLFVCVPMLVIYKYHIRLNFKWIVLLIVAFIVTLLLLKNMIPKPFERLQSVINFSFSNIDKTSSESTAVRALIWQQSVEIIKQNLLFGVGVGDANDALYQAYQNNGLSGAHEHRLNAHNQYLQTFIGMGLPGIFLLLALTLWQLWMAFRTRYFLFFIFSILMVLNFLVESMLQTAAGVLAFTFFYCFFNLTNDKQLQSA